MSLIDLSKPESQEVVQGFGSRAQRTVFIYRCHKCLHGDVRVRASTFLGMKRGKTGRVYPALAVPSQGSIHCPNCESSEAAAGPTR